MRDRLHVVALILVFPAVIMVTGVTVLLPLVLLPVLMLAPALIFGGGEPPQDPPEHGDDGGGGGSGDSGGPPRDPGGGIPLPDAQRGSWRLRDHAGVGRISSRPVRRRRCPGHEPVRHPERLPL